MVIRRRNTEVRQKQIVAAARKLIIKHGGEQVTIRRIAEAVGISEGAIYRHFKSKRDILALLAEDVEHTLLSDLNSDSILACTPLEALDSILRSHLSAIEQRRGVSFQVIAEIVAFGDKGLNKKISDSINKYIDSLAEILSRGIKSGEVKEDIDLKAVAFILFGTIQALVNVWALSNYSFDPKEKYASFWNIFRVTISKR